MGAQLRVCARTVRVLVRRCVLFVLCVCVFASVRVHMCACMQSSIAFFECTCAHIGCLCVLVCDSACVCASGRVLSQSDIFAVVARWLCHLFYFVSEVKLR